MSAFFHFQHTLNRLFSLKYEGGGQIDPPPEKNTLKKPSFIRVNVGATPNYKLLL